MTDEECIAIATLHGCGFVPSDSKQFWYVENSDGDMHPIEALNEIENSQIGFDSREELARAYCKHFNLER